jgi:chromate transporter
VKHAAELRELAALFLRLGFTAFGGPAAHVALMEDEVVRRRQWVSREEFLDLLGATNLIPGPNSTELAIHIGRIRAGMPGLIVAGTCFIVPAMSIVLACAWAYVNFGQLPQVEGILYGVKPVIIAVVAQALWGLTRSAVKTKWLAALGISAACASFIGVNELVVLFTGGLLVPLARGVFKKKKALPLLAWPALAAAATTSGSASFSFAGLFFFFLKVGAVLFGSGYVLLAFLRADLVDRWGWLTEAQLLDAVAIGQVTPGPVFTTATFIGYVLGGFPGAMLATLGIFLPAFVFVAISAPWIPRLRKSPVASGFLDGVNVTSLALMAVVTWHLARGAFQRGGILDVWAVLLAIVSAVLLFRFRVNSTWLVLGGALAGLALNCFD